jgi:hypothetical protein
MCSQRINCSPCCCVSKRIKCLSSNMCDTLILQLAAGGTAQKMTANLCFSHAFQQIDICSARRPRLKCSIPLIMGINYESSYFPMPDDRPLVQHLAFTSCRPATDGTLSAARTCHQHEQYLGTLSRPVSLISNVNSSSIFNIIILAPFRFFIPRARDAALCDHAVYVEASCIRPSCSSLAPGR